MADLPTDPKALLPILLTLLPIVLLIVLVPAIIFSWIAHRALARCAPSSRTMPPGQVWIGLIPFVNLLWPFRVVNAVARSLHSEFARRGIVEDSAPGKMIGTA